MCYQFASETVPHTLPVLSTGRPFQCIETTRGRRYNGVDGRSGLVVTRIIAVVAEIETRSLIAPERLQCLHLFPA